MQGPCIAGKPAAPSFGSQPQCQVQVLVVEEDALVEAADRLEGVASIERRPPARTEWGGRRERRFRRLTVQVVEPHQRPIGDHPRRVDPVRGALLQEHAGNRLHPGPEPVE